jgi:hypothetical protein
MNFTIYSRIGDLALWQYQGVMLFMAHLFPEGKWQKTTRQGNRFRVTDMGMGILTTAY